MNLRLARTVIGTAAMFVCWPNAASACSDPTEQWYSKVSDVVFDGNARCDPEARTCRILVSRVLKNPMNLAIEHQSIEVNFQNWFEDNYDPEVIVLTCGVRVFEPEAKRFRARFYANLDVKTSELIVRTHRRKGKSGITQESE